MTLARASDVRDLTQEQIDEHEHGLAMQVDRSQGHLKRDPTSLNVNNEPGINAGPGRKQPHFRHSFAPLSDGFTHWTQCRAALCEPGCAICQAAVNEHDHRPDFQSQGKKGTKNIFTEPDKYRPGMLAPEQRNCCRVSLFGDRRSQRCSPSDVRATRPPPHHWSSVSP